MSGDGLSWAAIAAISALVISLIGSLVAWMLWASGKLKVVADRVERLLDNHLPHIQGQLDELLRGDWPECRHHRKMLEDHEERIRDVED